MKRKMLVLLAVLMLAGLFAACGSGNDVKKTEPGTAAQSTSGTPDADLSWEEIQTNGKLVIGLDDTFAPMGFRDEAGTLVGFDIDLATAVCDVLGITAEFQPIAWSAKEMMLSSKRIDCVWNGMSATEERQKAMALTD